MQPEPSDRLPVVHRPIPLPFPGWHYRSYWHRPKKSEILRCAQEDKIDQDGRESHPVGQEGTSLMSLIYWLTPGRDIGSQRQLLLGINRRLGIAI